MVNKTKAGKPFLEYLAGFKRREDEFVLKPADIGIQDGGESPAFFSGNAYADLELKVLYEILISHVPNGRDTKTGWAIESLLHDPLIDRRQIERRQDTIETLFTNGGLNREATKVKICADNYQIANIPSRDHFSKDPQESQLTALEKARLFVNLIDSMNGMRESKSEILENIRLFGQRIYSDRRYSDVRAFIKELYEKYDLGANIALLRNRISKWDVSNIGAMREFYNAFKILEEITKRLLTEDQFRGFINKEAIEVNLLETIIQKSRTYYGEIAKFGTSIYNKADILRREGDELYNLLGYWLSFMEEAVMSRIPKIDVGKLNHALGFYVGAANLHKSWVKMGIPVARPKILEKTEQRARIIGSYNTTLVAGIGKYVDKDSLVPNDIIYDREQNLFIVTGPNNGGKTTYARQPGQIHGSIQTGMFIPAKEAEASIIDGIFTSISTGDNTQKGTGQYLTELKRVSEFAIRPKPEPHSAHSDETIYGDSHDKPAPMKYRRITPYSLLLFDEFANGTDHEESVERTKILLTHLSELGVTAYFTTHKHEIADLAEEGAFPGALNLAAEVRQEANNIILTHRILRNAREKSYGHIQAEAMGITKQGLRDTLEQELSLGAFPREATRLYRRG